jgi:hypothetical protein
MNAATSEEREKILGEAYAAAPSYIQDAIQAGYLDDMTAALTATNSYDKTTITRLENEVLMGILGITDLNDFLNILTEEVGLPPEKVDATLAIINETVFNPIAILGEDFTPSAEVPTATAALVVMSSVPQTVVPTSIPAPSTAVLTPTPTPSAPILGTQKYQDPKPAPVVVPMPVPKFRTMAMDVSGTKDLAPLRPTPTPTAGPKAAPSTPVPTPKTAVQSVAPAVIAPTIQKPPIVGAEKSVSQDLKAFGIDPYREPVE